MRPPSRPLRLFRLPSLRLTSSGTRPCSLFYHLKKDIFPRAYYAWMTQGQWYGKKGLFAPRYEEPEPVKSA